MVTFADISDLHFGCEDPCLIDELMGSLEKIRPQLVVVSGDITQRARKRELLAARAFHQHQLCWGISHICTES